MRSQQEMDMLVEAVSAATTPIFPTTKNEVIMSAMQQYGDNWKKTLASKIAAITGAKVESVGRQFRAGKGRAGSAPNAKNKAAFEQVGKTMDPIGRKVKGDSITVNVKGTQGEGRKERTRSIMVTLSGKKATGFVENPSYTDLWEEYDIEPEVFDDDDSSHLEITSVSAS